MIWNPSSEQMPRTELLHLQGERLRNTVQHVQANNAVLRERLRGASVDANVLRTTDDLRRLPFTTKSDLRDHYPTGLFCVPPDRVVRIHASSGTRGKPTIVGYTRNDLAVWSEVVARCLVQAGARPGSVLQVAYGYGLFTGGLGLHMGGELIGCQVIPLSGGNTPRQVLMMRDLGSEVLACTPSYALNIAGALDAQGVRPSDLRLRVGMFGAEPWSESLRAALESAFGLKAIDLYGLSEIIGPGVSGECAEGRDGLHVQEDHFLAEIVDAASGERVADGDEGELVLTTLTKEALPMLRYRTGDISSLNREPCRCGRTFARMRRIKGRYDDMLIVRGVNLYPSEVERIVLQFDELAPHYQLVLRRERALDNLEVQAEVQESYANALGVAWPDRPHEHPGLSSLSKRVAAALFGATALNVTVALQPPGSVPRSEGKAVRVVDLRDEGEA